jgi:cytochrome c
VRWLRAAPFCCVVALAASLLLARVHPFGDAGLYSRRGPETPMLNQGQVPDAVQAVLKEKCMDCHSDRPRVPFYGRLWPASWLMERDIVKARGAMNVSLWDGYSAAQQQIFAAKIEQQMKSRQMPPVQYRMIHWNARMKDADLRVLGAWAHGFQAVGAGVGGGEVGDPVRGKTLFEKRCTGCHTLTQNKEGPLLQGVYGRTSGTVAGFAYSAALKKTGVVWDEKSLEKWLADPDALIPGNDMDFLVSKAQERRDIVSYLRQSSGK